MAASQRRLIVVSNRLPMSVALQQGSFVLQASSGGLVTALRAVFREYDGHWIGWTGTEYSPEVEQLFLEAQQPFQMTPVFLSAEEKSKFYYGFSNEIIWPLFHDLQTCCNFAPTYWEAYVRVNEHFADKIAVTATDEDFIWIHDYHLVRTATALRARGLQSKLAYFHHIPFPSPDIFEKLPWKVDFLRSMLAFNLLGFQTARDQKNFIVCVKAFLRDVKILHQGEQAVVMHDGHATTIGNFPISIDFEEFALAADFDEVRELREKIRNDLHDRTLILGVDRLDYTKGLPEKLRSFKQMLEDFPEVHRKVALVQVVVPSREDIPKYQDLKLEIERLVSEINGRYTDPGWVPIHYMYRSLSRPELLALYRSADVALVTPLKDGMNLVAKEFCASQTEHRGVLILSEFAGAAAQLQRGAILVNPNDCLEVSRALHWALHLPEKEKRQRMKTLQSIIQRENVHQWTSKFFAAAGENLLHSHQNIVLNVSTEAHPVTFETYISTSEQRKLA